MQECMNGEFDAIYDTLRYGLSTLHFGIRIMEWILKVVVL